LWYACNSSAQQRAEEFQPSWEISTPQPKPLSMNRHREQITFWIQVLSFTGSVLFLLYVLFFGQPRSIECRECVDKLIYYQHKADSLQALIKQKQP
jgi:hypothetical protein